MSVEVLGLKKLEEFCNHHADASNGLRSWLSIMRQHGFDNFVDLKSYFPQVDYDKPYAVFNLGRNYRLIARVEYLTKHVIVKEIFTHPEYDKWNKARRKQQ